MSTVPSEIGSLRSDDWPLGALDFLAGGGEMGARMRAYDFRRTPLGEPARWPQSLKTAVRIMLTSRQPIWLGWGPELTYLYNDPYKAIIGGKHPEALGQPFHQVWREIWDVVGPMADTVIQRNEGTYVEAQLLIMERYGYPEETYYTFSYSPVPNDEGGPGGLICANTDDTRRVIGERQLETLTELAARTSTARGRPQACELSIAALAVNAVDLPFALILSAEDKAAAAWSTGAQSLAQAELWPCQEVVNGAQLVITPIKGEGVPRGPWPRAPTQAATIPITGPSRSGSGAVLVVGLNPYRRVDAEYLSFLNLIAQQIGSAITSAAAYEAEKQRAEALAELDRAKTTFFSNVSHEFRTPLTLIIGPIQEALANRELPDAARIQLELAQGNSARLLKLVNSLLDFARLEAGRVQASYAPTDLAKLTRDLASTFRSAVEKAGLVLQVDCPALTQDVYVDREMWEKIVLNLLSNALKFTLDGSIRVRLRSEGHEAVLEVSDSGVGIPQAELPRLFERFHRVEGSPGRTQEGSGIGLAMVQELIRLHGGSVAASSEAGIGSTFTVRVPLGAEHLPADRIRTQPSIDRTAADAQPFVQEALRWLPADSDANAPTPVLSDAGTPALGASFASTAGARIVLADDNADMRAYVRDLLSPYYEVEAVPNGEQALLAARRAPPDLVLSDVMMPRLDGFGLLRALRADENLRDIPLILLSARAGEEARVEGLQSGADDYLVKPFPSRELVARVGGHVALRRMRQTATAALRESEERFRALLTASSDVIFRMNSDWTEMQLLHGRRSTQPDDESGLPWLQRYVHAEDQAQVRATLESALRSRRVFELEYRTRTGDGGLTWILSRAVPMFDAAGKLVEWFGMSSDITAKKTHEQALRAADRQKDEFLAMLAHELRNPLAPIRNAGELLSRMLIAESRAQPVIEIVRRQVAHLSRLVDDLLDVSRITRGRIELRRESCAVSDVLRQAIETVEPLIRQRGHDLQIHSSYRALYVMGDSARLVQSLVNLMSNAAKYTAPGGQIVVRTREQDADVIIEVSDNGAGIPRQLLPRIFDLFVQADRTLDRSQGGLGIGLSVVQRLIEMHGGRAWAQSEGPNRGSTFSISLPLSDAPLLQGSETRIERVPPKRILIVDDNTDAADTLSMMLRLDGHETACAYGGQEALERIQLFAPQVVLLDIGLPGMDGYEVARRIRHMELGGGIRLIALTGYGQPEDRARALARGFDEHLVKPVNPKALSVALAGADALAAPAAPPKS